MEINRTELQRVRCTYDNFDGAELKDYKKHKFTKIINPKTYNFNKIDKIIKIQDTKTNVSLRWEFNTITKEITIFEIYLGGKILITYYSASEERKEKLKKIENVKNFYNQ